MNSEIFRIIILLLLLLYINKKKQKDFLTYIVFIVALVIGMAPINKVGHSYMIFSNPYLLSALIILIYEIGIIVYKKIRNIYYKVDSINDLISLEREINMEYNPSIIGYLFNQKLSMKDLSADILNLFAKKIIDIKRNEENKYMVYKGEKYDKYVYALQESDRYIVENTTNGFNDFSFEIWNKYVEQQYKRLDFSRQPRKMSNKSFFISLIATILLGTCIFYIFLKSFFNSFVISVVLALAETFLVNAIVQSKNNKNVILTKKGKTEIKKCLKLKKFMTEYTLLNNRSVEEIAIYEEYIPYAIALGVNRKYKKTIYDIFEEDELRNILNTIRSNKYTI